MHGFVLYQKQHIHCSETYYDIDTATVVKYRWPISLKQEISYYHCIISRYIEILQSFIQLDSKWIEFPVSFKKIMFLINQEKKIPNMLGDPSLNQSYILRCVLFSYGYSDFSMFYRVRGRGCSRNSNSDGVRTRLQRPNGRVR